MNQIFVTDIFANSNYNGYECMASIDNYSSLREKIAVGENVTSNEFEMIFPNSIGESKWRLLFYPKGQYVGEKVGSSIGIYLVMLSCEQECKTLKANVAFQLKSRIDCREPVKLLNTTFNYSIPEKRWIGEPDFVRFDWLNAKRRKHFCANDCLIIRCCVEESEADDTDSDDALSLPNDLLEPKPLLNHSVVQTSPLEQTLNTADGDQIQSKMEYGSSDDRENNNEQNWSTVNYGRSKRGKNMHPKNHCSEKCNTNSSMQKSSNNAKENERKPPTREAKEKSRFGKFVSFLTSCGE